MLFPFTMPLQGNAPSSTPFDVEEITKKTEEILDCLNDTTINPPTDEEHQELLEKMMEYMKEMGMELQCKASKPTNPVMAGLKTPFKLRIQTKQSLEEQFKGMVQTKHKDHIQFDEKQKTIFCEKFIIGLPEGQGYQTFILKN